ncbi:type I secretion system permease/ATPase [Pseudomonas sp. S 311-6]|uniref:type I secretion system permease/ATPase n=1 Tax=Kerstersia gyiorum TaxID=206506 RepID=UPI0010713ED0|nr:type I secretion system permease/ATPase [Kerstersia gyiorum]MCO7641528.1 type I secretion system permease/ATPase [Pseudomonas sp. S 311-6]QBR40479.1 type I secretion system permease/ATPase [Kerstersia gyiorum]
MTETDAGWQRDAVRERWMEALLQLARHYRLEVSPEHIRVSAVWSQNGDEREMVRQMARQAGMDLRYATPDFSRLTPWLLPVIVLMQDGQLAVLHEYAENTQECVLGFAGDQGMLTRVAMDELREQAQALVLCRPRHLPGDSRVAEMAADVDESWFRRLALPDLRPYGYIMLASLVANLLALAGVLFSMQVYDRVIPSGSMPTLYVLFGGVLLALACDFALRRARMTITDWMGKQADLRISDAVFGHALRVRTAAKPKATGTFLSQLRELEGVREMFTSTTLTAVADMPFFVLFCIVFAAIAGGMVWIPLVAAVLLVLPGLLMQKRLRRLAAAAIKESSLRHAVMVEAVQGSEDIKLLQAEQRFQNQWNHYNEVTAESNLELRHLTHTLTVWIQAVQASVFAFVVFFGAPMVMDGEMTTGVLVAASILSSRMISPMAQLGQVLNRWQQAKVAKEGLDQIMKLPLDQAGERKVHRPAIQGNYEFRDTVFGYEPETPVLQVGALKIAAGERIAVLGKNGSGKSTLLRALAGLTETGNGAVLLDGINMGHLDAADVRRDVALVSQQARLFHGTLRENLWLASPGASDEQLIAAMRLAGAWGFVQTLPMGLDHLVREGGAGLSGGQCQSLLLARALLREPSVLLLDEPTSALDEATEKQVIEALGQYCAGRTLIVATHRTSVLALVDRVLVLDRGRIAIDSRKEDLVRQMKGGDGGNRRQPAAGRTETQ